MLDSVRVNSESVVAVVAEVIALCEEGLKEVVEEGEEDTVAELDIAMCSHS